MTAVEEEEVTLIDSLHIQIHAQSKLTASRSQGLNISWRPSSTSNIFPGRSLLLLSHLCIRFTHTAPKPSYFFCLADVGSLSHTHHPYTVTMYIHTVYIYIYTVCIYIYSFFSLGLSLINFHPVRA